jgi:hypothetical protein
MYASLDAYFGGDGIRDGEVLLRYTSRILVLYYFWISLNCWFSTEVSGCPFLEILWAWIILFYLRQVDTFLFSKSCK